MKQLKDYIQILEKRRLEYLNHESTNTDDVFNYRYNIGSVHRLYDVIQELNELLTKIKNMKQLNLSENQLITIGFKKNKRTFEIEVINGCFYYNPNEEIYKWYHKTMIHNKSNHIHLDIKTIDDLYQVLTIFKVKFKKINDFKEIVKPVMKYLAENHHPHTMIEIDSNKSILWEGQKTVVTDEYIVD
jgi:hypothetical protein